MVYFLGELLSDDEAEMDEGKEARYQVENEEITSESRNSNEFQIKETNRNKGWIK